MNRYTTTEDRRLAAVLGEDPWTRMSLTRKRIHGASLFLAVFVLPFLPIGGA